MKKPIFLIAILATLLAFTTACNTDPVEPTGPTASLIAGAEAITDTGSVALDSTFLVKVSATSGDVALSRIEIRENGTAIDFSRLTFDGDPAGSNPSPLAPDTRSLNWDVLVVGPSAEGDYTYEAILTDENGLTARVDWDVNAFIPFTAVDTMQMVLLFNQAGPAGFGGLDLETKESTGTADTETTHDIADLGIDDNLPLADNWKQQFEPKNGAVLRAVNDGITFDEFTFKEQIEELYNDDSRSVEVAVTDRVDIGDLFLVKTEGGTIYLLNTVDIVIIEGTPNTADDKNKDRYVFSVKF